MRKACPGREGVFFMPEKERRIGEDAMRRRFLLGVVACMAGAFFLSSCIGWEYCELGPQSHFVYPNSNVEELGPVLVKKYKWDIGFFFSAQSSEIDEDLFNAALAQCSDANLIVNYAKVVSGYFIWPLPVVLYKIALEGTAARAEVGKQQLK